LNYNFLIFGLLFIIPRQEGNYLLVVVISLNKKFTHHHSLNKNKEETGIFIQNATSRIQDFLNV